MEDGNHQELKKKTMLFNEYHKKILDYQNRCLEFEKQIAALKDDSSKARTHFMRVAERVAGNYEDYHSGVLALEQEYSQDFDKLAEMLGDEQANNESLVARNILLTNQLRAVSQENDVIRRQINQLTNELQDQKSMVEGLSDEWNSREMELSRSQNQEFSIKTTLCRQFETLKRDFERLKKDTKEDLGNTKEVIERARKDLGEYCSSYSDLTSSKTADLESQLESAKDVREQLETKIRDQEVKFDELRANSDAEIQKLTEKMKSLNDDLKADKHELHQTSRSLETYVELYGDESQESHSMQQQLSVLNQCVKRIAFSLVAHSSSDMIYSEYLPVHSQTVVMPKPDAWGSGMVLGETISQAVEAVLTHRQHQIMELVRALDQRTDELERVREQRREEVKKRGFLERDMQGMKGELEHARTKEKSVAREFHRMKKAINSFNREKELCSEATAKLEERLKELQEQNRSMKDELQQKTSREHQLEKDVLELRVTSDLNEKHHKSRSEQAASQLAELTSLREQVKEQRALLDKRSQERVILLQEKSQLTHNRVGCVDPDVPLDAQLLFYKPAYASAPGYPMTTRYTTTSPQYVGPYNFT